jgi:hypothetical protein
MNKQIKQLAEQAKFPDYVLKYGTELCLAPHLENLAELIVKECDTILSDLITEYREAGKAQRIDNEAQAKALAIASARITAKFRG